jgi:hypothetical protein
MLPTKLAPQAANIAENASAKLTMKNTSRVYFIMRAVAYSLPEYALPPLAERFSTAGKKFLPRLILKN